MLYLKLVRHYMFFSKENCFIISPSTGRSEVRFSLRTAVMTLGGTLAQWHMSRMDAHQQSDPLVDKWAVRTTEEIFPHSFCSSSFPLYLSSLTSLLMQINHLNYSFNLYTYNKYAKGTRQPHDVSLLISRNSLNCVIDTSGHCYMFEEYLWNKWNCRKRKTASAVNTLYESTWVCELDIFFSGCLSHLSLLIFSS